MTVNDDGFCDGTCDDCGDDIRHGEWHVHTNDEESKCLDCAESDLGDDGLGMYQEENERFAKEGGGK